MNGFGKGEWCAAIPSQIDGLRRQKMFPPFSASLVLDQLRLLARLGKDRQIPRGRPKLHIDDNYICRYVVQALCRWHFCHFPAGVFKCCHGFRRGWRHGMRLGRHAGPRVWPIRPAGKAGLRPAELRCRSRSARRGSGSVTKHDKMANIWQRCQVGHLV